MSPASRRPARGGKAPSSGPLRPPSRPPQRASSVPTVGPASVPPSARAGAGSSRLKLLLAGVDSDTRSVVEADVRRALGARATDEPWTVSLVRVAGRWSVTLDGPEPRFRNLSLTAREDELVDRIRELVGGPPTALEPAPSGPEAGSAGPVQPGEAARSRAPAFHPGPTSAGAGETRVSLHCESCGGGVVVVYEARAGEPLVQAAVACPHCWQVNRVTIGDWAAAGKDYRAEKA